MRAAGQQQMFAADAHRLLPAALVRLHFDGLAVEDTRPAAYHAHALFFQQGAHAAGQALDDAVLPGHRFFEVDAGRIHLDPQW